MCWENAYVLIFLIIILALSAILAFFYGSDDHIQKLTKTTVILNAITSTKTLSI